MDVASQDPEIRLVLDQLGPVAALEEVPAMAVATSPPIGVRRERGQFGVSSSLLLPLHQVGKLDSWEDLQDRQAMTLFTTHSSGDTILNFSELGMVSPGTIRCRDNSVSVRHYCFPCIKSVSWIHGKTCKTDRR